MAKRLDNMIRVFARKNFTITTCALPEDNLDLSWDEDGETRKGLENGSLVAFVFCVRVYCKGNEVASTYLSNCIYRSIDEFQDHFGRNAKGYGSYFSDLVREAIADARKHVCDLKAIPMRCA